MNGFMNQMFYNPYAGLLGTEEDARLQQAARQQGLLNIAASLLQAGGPSYQPQGLGAALGRGVLSGQQAAQDVYMQGLRGSMMKQQMEDEKRKREAEKTFQERLAGATKTVPTGIGAGEAQQQALMGQMMFPGETQVPAADVLSTREALLSNVNLPQQTVVDQEAADRAVMDYLRVASPVEYAKLVSKEPKGPPGVVGEYLAAVQAGLISPDTKLENYIEMKKQAGTTVNIGQGKVGTIPPGFELREDPKTGALSMVPIPGGPAEKEIEEEERRRRQAQESQGAVAGFTLRDARIVNESIDEMSSNPVVRLAKARIPLFNTLTPEYRAEQFMDSLRGTVAIEQLLNIKRQGAGLGQVPQAQLDMLSFLMGKLDLGLPKEDLKLIIGDIQTRYREILSNMTPEDRALIGIADREYNELTGRGGSGRGRGGSKRRPLGDILRGPR
jgi:hypothetical protein